MDDRRHVAVLAYEEEALFGEMVNTPLEAKLRELQAVNAQLTSVNERMGTELKRRDENLQCMRDERRCMLESLDDIMQRRGSPVEDGEASLDLLRSELRSQAETITSLQGEISKLNSKHKQTCRVLVARVAAEMGRSKDLEVTSDDGHPEQPTRWTSWLFGDCSGVSCEPREDGSLEATVARLRRKPVEAIDDGVNLSNSDVGDSDVEALAEAMRASAFPVETLNLGGNNIGARGAAHIAEFLQSKACVLSTLGLRWNDVGDAGASALFLALELNNTLTTLDLWRNGLGPSTADALCDALKHNQALEHLTLWDNDIGDQGVDKLAQGLAQNSTLVSVDIDSNHVGDIGPLCDALVSRNTTLTSLSCGNNPSLGAQGAAALARVLASPTARLTSLYAENCGFGDSGAQTLARALSYNATLVEANLAKNHIHHDGGHAIADALRAGRDQANRTLKRLHLDANVLLGQDAVLALCQAPMLQELTLAQVALGSETASLLAQLLAQGKAPSLRTLDLKATGIDAIAKSELRAAARAVLPWSSGPRTLDSPAEYPGDDGLLLIKL